MSMDECSFEKLFIGIVTVGERGQVVIPAEGRQELGINAGDKLVMVKHPHNHGLMLFKVGALRQFLEQLQAGVSYVEQNLGDEQQ